MANEDRSFGAVIYDDHPIWKVVEVHAFTAQEARQMRTVFQFDVNDAGGNGIENVAIKIEHQRFPRGHIRDWETWWGLTAENGHAEFVHPNRRIRYVVFMGEVDEYGRVTWDEAPIIENLRTDIGSEPGEEPYEYYRPGGAAQFGGWRPVNPPWRYRIKIQQRPQSTA